MIEEKRCTKCKEIKSVSEFGRDKYRKDGLCCRCKCCRNADGKPWREEHPNYYKQHYIEHPNYYIHYRENNKIRKKLWAAEYIQSERGRLLHREGHRRRRASKWRAEGFHTAKDVINQGDKQNWVCYWRGVGCIEYCKNNYHVDHYIPLSRGGSNWPENIVISCPTCNLRKHNKTPDEFREYLRRLTK